MSESGLTFKFKNISRTVWILSIVSMFADIGSEMLYPVIPIYLKNIGFSVFLIGLLEGVAEATAGISKGYFGNLSDITGKRVPFIRLGYFLSAVAKPMMAVIKFPLWVFFARTLDRIGKGLRTAPRDAMLSDESTAETKASVFGFHRGWDTLGAVFGPAIALLFISFNVAEIETLFFLSFIPGIIAVGFTYLIRDKNYKPVNQTRGNLFSFFKYWKTSGKEYKKITSALIAFALFNSSDMLLLLKVKETSGSDIYVLVVYIFFNLFYSFLSYPMGIWADKIGIKKIFLLGLIMFAVVYFGMAVVETGYIFFILFGIYGWYMAATEGISKAWIAGISKSGEVGTAIGLFIALQTIALMLASIFAGLIWSYYGASVTFILTAIVSLLVFFFILTFVRKPDPEQV